jgi:prepilin-type N-terminal cleavage/methylation domain-containing protein
MKSQKGFGLIEVLISVAIIATAGIAFLGGLTISTKILTQTDTSETSRDLAVTQMEFVKSMPYSPNDWEYTLSTTDLVSTPPKQPVWWTNPDSLPSLLDSEKYSGYSIKATAEKLDGNNDANIKSITIVVYKNNTPKQTLVSYLFNSSGQ